MNLTCRNIYSLVKFDGMRFKGRIEPLRSMPKDFTGDDKDVLAKFVFYYTSAGALYGMLLYFPIFDCVSFTPHSQSKTAHETESLHNTKQQYGSGAQTCSPKQPRNWDTRSLP